MIASFVRPFGGRTLIIPGGVSGGHVTPHVDCGDFVVVINADKVKFTGKKCPPSAPMRQIEGSV
ncbi:uL13 family ribosomal protein [Klebsiella sp. SWET4]|uniref:uL13 family ribosomal protein n=1 Tax=Klebsiella sp. SWET4 TaxID=2961620 RepID=UPI0035C84A36